MPSVSSAWAMPSLTPHSSKEELLKNVAVDPDASLLHVVFQRQLSIETDENVLLLVCSNEEHRV